MTLNSAHNQRPTPWSVLRRAGLRECLTAASLYAAAGIIGIVAAVEMGLWS
jgi:hypothetical protein